ncbi:MAG: hypothetical protein ACI8ZM_003837 [Crocinitomix sp.]|jgi:hypothetical protein
MQHIIPSLEPGQKYRIIFRSDNFSTAIFKKANERGIPGVNFGEYCICCNALTQEYQYIDPFKDNRFLVGKGIKIPVCNRCTDHAFKRNRIHYYYSLAVLAAVIVILISFFSFRNDAKTIVNYWLLTGLGLIASFIGIFFYLRFKRKRNMEATEHSPRTKIISFADGELMVESGNFKLIRKLIEENGGIIAIIDTTGVSYAKTVRKI